MSASVELNRPAPISDEKKVMEEKQTFEDNAPNSVEVINVDAQENGLKNGVSVESHTDQDHKLNLVMQKVMEEITATVKKAIASMNEEEENERRLDEVVVEVSSTVRKAIHPFFSKAPRGKRMEPRQANIKRKTELTRKKRSSRIAKKRTSSESVMTLRSFFKTSEQKTKDTVKDVSDAEEIDPESESGDSASDLDDMDHVPESDSDDDFVDAPTKPQKSAKSSRRSRASTAKNRSSSERKPRAKAKRERTKSLVVPKIGSKRPLDSGIVPNRPRVENQPNRELHPFFKSTTANVQKDKDRPKRRRLVRESIDPWNYIGATIHANMNIVSKLWVPPPPLFEHTADIGVICNIPFGYKSSPASVHNGCRRALRDDWIPRSSVLRPWSETYKDDVAMNRINSTAISKLTDFLKRWYEPPSGKPWEEEVTDDSASGFFGEDMGARRESVIILTGKVGSGKSTVISNAANQLGLSILEVNAGVCRTGRKVKEIVKEALRTHRLSTNNNVPKNHEQLRSPGAQPSAKSLIVFEEVDQLNDDEKGFWRCIHELATDKECKRPIVCTANTFSHQMRQIFVEEKSQQRADIDRLLICTREEQILDPIPFKHINVQSDFDTSVVLQHVSQSENTTDVSQSLLGGLSLAAQHDSRKAINQLHFWGSGGLQKDGSSRDPSEVEMAIVLSMNDKSGPEDVYLATTEFMSAANTIQGIGSEDHCEANYASSRTKGHERSLATWCSTLESLCSADMIRTAVNEQALVRTVGDEEEECASLCMHDDLQEALAISDILGREAAKRLLLRAEELPKVVSDIGKVCAVEQDELQLPRGSCPKARRPTATDYLPILRTMADRRGTTASSDQVERLERSHGLRRTRASLRRGGFAALDMNQVTVGELKKSSLSRQM